ncbi:hypothetical protein Misp06_01030 [Microbulbifer sp. NBRC 101763]|uniref:TetR/AcrR family transcriptional regulator n=1 Tax=Microbulbifer sp. NBRC 101763 TaxID=1113820 RepID=UPI0030B73784
MKTREKLLLKAEILFSERGFYGTSINDVAAELTISKQGLLHHFPSKEKLYAAVLESAVTHLVEDLKPNIEHELAPREQLLNLLNVLAAPDKRTHRVILLLMRELLDNKERSEHAHQWFLKPVLDHLEGLVKASQKQGHFQEIKPLAFIYQLLGAVQYFLISEPTLKKLYSAKTFKTLKKQHLIELERLITSAY